MQVSVPVSCSEKHVRASANDFRQGYARIILFAGFMTTAVRKMFRERDISIRECVCL